MKKSLLINNVWATAILSIFFWIIFVVSLAWSVMRYNYARIPHDITIASSLEGIIVMGIVVSAIPFMLATLCTYRTIDLLANGKQIAK